MYEKKRVFLPISTWSRTPRVGIYGNTSMGKALENSLLNVETFIADDSIGVSIDNLMDFGPDLVFISEDVKLHETGRMDATKTEDAFLKLLRRTKAAVVVCSTVTPDIAERMCASIDDPEEISRFLFWPQTISNTQIENLIRDISFSVVGGRNECVNEFRHFTNVYTDIMLPNCIVVNPIEAMYIKCAVSNYHAMKVSFFNELYESLLHDNNEKCSAQVVMKGVGTHFDVGRSYSRVPYKGVRGFSGTLEDEVVAWSNFTSNSALMQRVLEVNSTLQQTEEDEGEFDVFDNEQTQEKQ